MAAPKALLAVLLLALVALAAGATRKQCLDIYTAQLRNNERTGRYDNYAALAKQYTDCLARATGSGYKRRNLLTPSAQAQQDCIDAYNVAVANARRAKDQTAIRNLGFARDRCVAGK